ncbi:hypothetical protein VTG60DRAFT_3323 [Thermothelomyces hinnuleus]
MAGPRAPIGTLSQHAAAAAGLVRGMVPKMFGRTDPKQTRKTEEITESDSTSDSDSSTDGDSETDEAVREDTKNWADKLKAKKAGSTPTPASKPVKAAPVSAASPNAKSSSRATKSDIKKSSSSDSSASESESDSDSESESGEGDDKMAVDPKSDSEVVSKKTKNGGPKVKEEVESGSDSESSDEEMGDSAPTEKAAPSPSSSETSASEDESDDETPAPATSLTHKKDAAAKAVSSSDESASESESESESDGGSDSDSGSDEDTKHPQKSQSKRQQSPRPTAKQAASAKQPVPTKSAKSSAAINGAAKSKEMVSESDSSSDAESGDGSDSESTAESTAVEKQSGKNSVQAPPREIISQGFHLRKAEEDVDAAEVVRAFKKAKAEGKQIWYFTTPKSVPIEVIQKHVIPLDKVHAGKAIFAHDGAEYTGHFEEPVNHAIKVLIPGKTGAKYETLHHSVDRVLHITRVTRLGEEGADESVPVTTSVSSPAPVSQGPRPQPKGLKARYQPFGVTKASSSALGMDASDNEDVEMAQAPPLTAKSDTPKAAKKRKHGDVDKGANKEESTSTPANKPKKARVDNSGTKAAKDTPVVPPSVASASTKTTEQTSPSKKKSKGKDKAKKNDSASSETLTGESKKPTKVTPIFPPAIPGVTSP